MARVFRSIRRYGIAATGLGSMSAALVAQFSGLDPLDLQFARTVELAGLLALFFLPIAAVAALRMERRARMAARARSAA